MPKHILIVDDSKTVRNLVAFIMKREGFQVTTAEDGLEGLEKLYGANHVDLVIADINMPRMDGLCFIENMREQKGYRDLPVIVLSTEGEDRDIESALSIGANIYMVKPAQPEKLMKNAKMLLGVSGEEGIS
ncbi:two-component system, chemotaxis family, response regulator CheY [Paucidesulfovibrio gracilis DSM 16080]|uniref:Two-component system, chemotaxis family, response regulator CheY n=1 Tax=Paucidesulfovibrio gracilis DSM 16080 TaxID=1121449 RepID=A0A1T4XX99_9BACT|nr:response regulator [Paucidesulfovibrio gracilis]SKA94160.1 two-component system, chemotaxis family, response regulator CheY [Paucidesulfovibrio gracilis DSM 16080]